MSTKPVALVVALAALIAGPTLFAQSTVTDPIRELLTEVRALRLAMERQATVGARIQVLVARVQLQEQRIAETARRATSVRNEAASLDAEIARMSTQVKAVESGTPRARAEDREEIERMLEQLKVQLATIEKRRQDLANEESFLTQQLSLEQGRWTTINDQLDQLERSLAGGK